MEQTLRGNGLITLHVPFGEDLQKEAATLFDGAFSYYRNYAAHDGTRISRQVALRVMVLASELLDLVAASPRSLTNLGGVSGLIERGVFKSARHLVSTLQFLDGVAFPDDAPDGFLYEMAEAGVGEEEISVLFDLGLIDWHSLVVEDEQFPEMHTQYDMTAQGKEVLLRAERLAQTELEEVSGENGV